MSEGPRFVNLNWYVNPLEKAARGWVESGGSQDGLAILRKALAIALELQGGGDAESIERERESIRRTLTLPASELHRLGDVARRIGTESRSYLNQYALAELVHAAAVSSVSLGARNAISLLLAEAAKQFGRFEGARRAYTDVLEGIQILRRFFEASTTYASMEDEIRSDWGTLRSRYPNQLELLEPTADDPTEEWERLLLWNTDLKGGVTVQGDAMLRLAFRFEYWRDVQGRHIGPPAERLDARIRETIGAANRGRALRCRWTLADALMEVSEWDSALTLHEQILCEARETGDQFGAIHGVAQAACCELMAGDHERALARVDAVNWRELEKMAASLVSLAADYARLVALHHACRSRCGVGEVPDVHDELAKYMGTVALVIRREPGNRIDYLRSLFAAINSRDVNSIMSMAG